MSIPPLLSRPACCFYCSASRLTCNAAGKSHHTYFITSRHKVNQQYKGCLPTVGRASSSGAISGAMNPHNHDKKGFVLNYQVSRTPKKKKEILRREKGRQWIWKRNVCFSTHISGQQESPCWKESRECASCSEGKMGGCEGSMVESLQENVVTGLLFMS